MKNFTCLDDVPDPASLVKQALALKKQPLQYDTIGKGKRLVLLFFNPSLRTRLSTQAAAQNLGMHVICMNTNSGWSLEFEDQVVMNGQSAEHIREAAAVVSQYADIIGIRTFPSLNDREKDYSDFILQQFTRFAQVPVVSLESAIRHPLQSLADLMTIQELQTKSKPKVVVSWAPHPKALPQAVTNSFLEWISTSDAEVVLTHPKGYELSPMFSQKLQPVYNQNEALEGADFVYVKNWSAFHEYGKVLQQDLQWTITLDKLKHTQQAKVLHCLPVRRNVVIEEKVLDSPHSAVIQQADNRTYAAQAVLKNILE
ncbi:MAG: acetylornithine carbamoyltransferase [Bacteroidota bacterium]